VAALERAPEHREVLTRLFALERRLGELDAASATGKRLGALLRDPTEQARHASGLAELDEQRGDHEAAALGRERAVALTGLGEASRAWRAALEARGSAPGWTRYATALVKRLDQPGLGLDQIAATLVEIARVQFAQLAQPDSAIATLKRGLGVAPDDGALNQELARFLRLSGGYAAALPVQRHLLDIDVMRPEVWRELGDTFAKLGRIDEQRLTLAPLAVLGAASDAEQIELVARGGPAARARAASFDSGSIAPLGPLPSLDAVGAVLEASAEVLPKIHPPELERFGLSTRDRITARSGNPLRTLSDRIAQAFGVAEHDLYVHRAHSGGVEIEFSEPVSICVPAALLSLTEHQQSFLIARAFASVCRGFAVIERLPPRTIELFYGAALRAVDPSHLVAPADEAQVVELSRRVQRAISRRGKKTLEEASQGNLPQQVDFAQWVHKARLGSARAALVYADDLPGSIGLLRRLEGDLAGLKGPALAQAVAALHDLMRFWISDQATALRRRSGLMA
jgi:cellulose synthase operon protein C